MRPGRRAVAALAALLCAGAALAEESSVVRFGEELKPREHTEVTVSGYFRTRFEALDNFDLDRGTTPSGQPLFPVPLADPNGQILTYADARLRFDLAVFAPGRSVSVHLRTDVFDNQPLGGDPQLTSGSGGLPNPGGSTTQRPIQLLRIKRLYGELLTPLGLIVVGRMGAHWGLGMVSNGGECLDCDGGDAGDGVGFVTSMLGHFWAVMFNLTSVGPVRARPADLTSIDIEPTDDVRTIAFALLRYANDNTRERRRADSLSTFEYGANLTYRWQDNDIPTAYLNGTPSSAIEPSQVVYRGLRAYGADVWARFTGRWLRVEAEAALLLANLEQISVIPGVLFRDNVQSRMFGAALESDIGPPEAAFRAGIDMGFASGDPAPGFGAYPSGSAAPAPGELEGPQAYVPNDLRIDNFRFSPDYRIDRILFAQIIGTVTDAIYIRPHLRYRLFDSKGSKLTFSLVGVASRAVEASSTPSGKPELGIEIDSSLTYESTLGINARLEYAVLFPLAGFENPAQGLSPTPAQLFRLRLAYVF
jgi:uncharacterized protein (TIGR04551 family)